MDRSSWAAMIRGTKSVSQTEFCYSIALNGNKVMVSILHTKSPSYIVEQAIDCCKSTTALLTSPIVQANWEEPRPVVNLKYIFKSLNAFKTYVTPQQELVDAVESLKTAVLTIQSAEIPSMDIDPLQLLREALFWIPTRFISRIHSEPDVMLLQAYLHAVALAVETDSESISQAYYRSLNSGPIEAMYEEFLLKSESLLVKEEDRVKYQDCLEMMSFPMNVVDEFKERLGAVAEEGEEAITQYICSGRLSKFTVLENFPVGLWHNFL